MNICGTPPRDRTCFGIDESYLFVLVFFHFGFGVLILKEKQFGDNLVVL